MSQHLPGAPLGIEVACGYLADVLAALAATGGPIVVSRDLEEATRQLARATYRADLSDGALVRWLGVASATAFGGGAASVALTRQLHVWAAHEYAAAACASGRPWVAQVA